MALFHNVRRVITNARPDCRSTDIGTNYSSTGFQLVGRAVCPSARETVQTRQSANTNNTEHAFKNLLTQIRLGLRVTSVYLPG